MELESGKCQIQTRNKSSIPTFPSSWPTSRPLLSSGCCRVLPTLRSTPRTLVVARAIKPARHHKLFVWQIIYILSHGLKVATAATTASFTCPLYFPSGAETFRNVHYFRGSASLPPEAHNLDVLLRAEDAMSFLSSCGLLCNWTKDGAARRGYAKRRTNGRIKSSTA